MTISNFVAYVKQVWKNKPDTSTPLSADRLLHIEDGIKGNSDAIEAIAAAVVSQIVNDPDKIASMAALYAVDKKIGNVADLPNSAADVVTAITQQNSNINLLSLLRAETDVASDLNGIVTGKVQISIAGKDTLNTPYKQGLTGLVSGCCFSYANSATYAVQLYLATGTNALYVRYLNNGSWSSWTAK